MIDTAPDTGPVVLHDNTGSGIDGAMIHGAGATWADNHNGVRVEWCDQCFIRNAMIDNFKSLQGGTSRNGSGVTMYDSDDLLIEHNEIFNCGSGIYIKGVRPPGTQDRTVVRFNLIHDVLSHGVIVQAAVDGRVYQNIIRDNPVGILFNAAGEEPGGHPVNPVVANNTLDGNGAPVVHNTEMIENGRFWNNIVTNSNVAHYGDSQTGPNDNDIENNNYYGNSTFAHFTGGNYDFAQWRSAFSQDANSITTDPLFVDGANDDFHLQQGSLARTLGVDLLDLNNNGSTTDLVPAGAYVTGDEIIGRGGGGGGPPPPPPPPPAPTLSLPAYLPVNGTISAGYPAGYRNISFRWAIDLATGAYANVGTGPTSTRGLSPFLHWAPASAGVTNRALSATFTSGAVASLAGYALEPGYYRVTVQAVNAAGGVSAPAQGYVTLVSADFSGLRVFPNPWRSDRHAAQSVTFDGLPLGSSVKLFTVSGRLVKTLTPAITSATWDLANDKGDKVASGIYVYLITVGNSGDKARGKVVVIK